MSRKETVFPHITLSEADKKTILFCLCLVESLDYEESDIQRNINFALCTSVNGKLEAGIFDFSANECRMIAAGLQAASYVLSGELPVDKNISKDCSNYLFSINKLLPVFSCVLDACDPNIR